MLFRKTGIVGLWIVVSIAAAAAPNPSAPKGPKPYIPGDYLTDLEKDYFQGKISTWAYYASPLFIGGNPATERMQFWDRVNYEWIFFPNFPRSTYAMIKDLFVDWWREMGMTWYRQIVTKGFRGDGSVRRVRNISLGLVDGLMDGVHELFDAVKIWDGHWKLPFHPGCTYEGGPRLLSIIVNKGLVEPTKPIKPLYYTLYPIGWTTDFVAKGFNAGFLIGIKICKWPPMLAEDLVFGGWDLITFREHRGPFKDKFLPFSWKSGCVLYMYGGDMNYRRGPELRTHRPPRKTREEKRLEKEKKRRTKRKKQEQRKK